MTLLLHQLYLKSTPTQLPTRFPRQNLLRPTELIIFRTLEIEDESFYSSVPASFNFFRNTSQKLKGLIFPFYRQYQPRENTHAILKWDQSDSPTIMPAKLQNWKIYYCTSSPCNKDSTLTKLCLRSLFTHTLSRAILGYKFSHSIFEGIISASYLFPCQQQYSSTANSVFTLFHVVDLYLVSSTKHISLHKKWFREKFLDFITDY